MKKIIIAAVVAVLVLVAYLAQVAYMGSLNEKIYTLITTHKNDIVSIEIVDFQKGFFNHKAKVNLYIKIPNDDMVRGMGLSQTPIPAEIHLKNNIFAKDNIIIDIENPLYEIMKGALASSDGQMNFDKVFLRIKIALSLSQKIAVKTEFTDIDIKQQGLEFSLKNFGGTLSMDTNGVLYDTVVNLDELNFKMNVWGNTLSFFIGKTIFDSKFEAGVTFDDYLNNLTAGVAGKSKGSIEKISFDDLTITGIKYDENSSVENELINSVADINIQSITSDLKGIFLDNIRSHIEIGNFSPTFLNVLERYNPSINDETILMEFFASNPVVEVSDLSFNSKGKEFNSQGTLRGSLSDYHITFSAQSQAAPSEILPPFSFIGIDEFFVQKDGKYVADFLLESDYKSTKMLLNGKDISKEETVIVD